MSLSSVQNFPEWTQIDWINFFASGSYEHLDRSLRIDPLFQEKLLEVGVFGGREFLERVPFLTKSQPNPYPVARIVSFVWGQQYQYLLFQSVDSDPIYLEKCVYPSKREFWSVTSLKTEHANLVTQPALFATVTAIAGVDRVAKHTLTCFLLPRGVTRLALEYAGYPQTSRVRAQETHERLFQRLHERNRESAPLAIDINNRQNKSVENIATTIGEYIGSDDRTDDESDATIIKTP